MRTLASVALAMLALGIAGCVPAPLDLAAHACPCAAGWTCDTAANRCVQGATDAATTPDAPGADTGSDAAMLDDTGVDAFVAPGDGGSDAGVDAFVAPVDGGPDAGHDGGMPGDTLCTTTLASAVVCDGFETDPGPWTGVGSRTGSVATSGAEAQRGTRSLHATTTAPGGRAAREFEPMGPYATGDLWIRIQAYVPSTANVVDFTWLSVGETSAPYHGISLGMGGSDTVGSYSTISATYVSDSALVLPRDSWQCLELHIAISDTAGAIEIYRNGALAASHTAIDTLPAAAFTAFGVGIDYTDPTSQPGLETYLDEVALSRARLPCP